MVIYLFYSIIFSQCLCLIYTYLRLKYNKLMKHLFQIMPRSQNAHAIVNAGFLYRLRQPDNIVRQTRIVYSGINANVSITRPSATERYLFGKKLFTDDTLQASVKIMENELIATENPPEPSAEYRKQLALGLFYKASIDFAEVSPCH